MTEKESKRTLYNDVLEYIKPSPSWTGLDNHHSKEELMTQFSLDESTVDQLINQLIIEKKLTKDGGTYRSIRCCSVCGKEFDDLDIQENNHFVKHFGYGSKHDLDIIDIDLCIDCMDRLVDIILPHLPNECLRCESESIDGNPF